MKKLKLLMALGGLWLAPMAGPIVADAAVTTVNVVYDDSPSIANSNYKATLKDGTILGFATGWDEAYFCGAVSKSTEITVPDSIKADDWERAVAVKFCGNGGCDFHDAESVITLTLPATTEGIWYLPTTVKVLHLNNYVDQIWDEARHSLEKIFVPEHTLNDYLENESWRNYVLINAEGSEPLKITVNMTKAGEFAQLFLQQTDNWYKVNELVVVGELNEDDLNVFKRMKQLTMLDLSRAVIEDIPDYFDGAGSPNSYRDGFNILETLLLPEVNNIGEYAFSQCYRLKNITLPKVSEIKYGAFAQCGAKEIDLPQGLVSIGDWAFSYSEFESVEIPSTVTRIGECCFFESKLSSISLPESVREIRDNTFFRSMLTSVDLTNVEKIGNFAFYECKELADVRFRDGLEEIGYQAFYSCDSLEAIDLPGTLINVNGEAFGNCRSIKSVTSRAVIPPTHNGGYPILYDRDMTDVKLYVPAISIDNYRKENGWKSFYTILPMEKKISNAHIYDDLTVDDASIFSDDAKILIDWQYQYREEDWSTYCGAFEYNGSSTLSINDFCQYHDLWYGDYDSYFNETHFTSLMPNGPMRADNVHTSLRVHNYIWYFISLPYDVKVADITYTEGTQFAIRKYSGFNRANQSGDTWQDLTTDSIMHAYEGYILRCNKDDADFVFHAVNNGNKNKVFEKESVVMPLGEYLSEFEHNRSWNLIGNPYPCYYDTRYMDFTAPITVWNSNNMRYDAYSPIDDSYILHPTQAFFVQRPIAQSTITFEKAGRQKNAMVRDTEPRSSIHKIAAFDTRKVFNVILSDGKISDHTRFVINSEAACGYELDKDASKFIAGDNRSVLVYTVENGVRYAINERPLLDGVVHLGFYAPSSGEYTLSVNTEYSDNVTLTDVEDDMETLLTGEYRFYAKAGYNDVRFTLTLGGTTGVGSIISDLKEQGDVRNDVYTTDGRLVGTYTEAEISNLAKGIYIVNGKDVKRKIVVK